MKILENSVFIPRRTLFTKKLNKFSQKLSRSFSRVRARQHDSFSSLTFYLSMKLKSVVGKKNNSFTVLFLSSLASPYCYDVCWSRNSLPHRQRNIRNCGKCGEKTTTPKKYFSFFFSWVVGFHVCFFRQIFLCKTHLSISLLHTSPQVFVLKVLGEAVDKFF